jgi:catechol 2,3-dioxygenase-like lactoylglutathione lyase family enzyme
MDVPAPDTTSGRLFGAARAVGITHSSLAVDDLDLSVAFYRDAFQCELVFEARDLTDLIQSVAGIPDLRCDLAILRPPGSSHLLELIAFRNPAAPVWSAPPAGHVEFAVADLDCSIAAVEELGATPVGQVTSFPEGPSVYYREPGGSVFELTEYTA